MISHISCMIKEIKYVIPITVILTHFNSVVCMAPDASTFLAQRKMVKPIKLKISIYLPSFLNSSKS